LRPFFFKQYVSPVDRVRPSDRYTRRYVAPKAAKKTGVIRKFLSWLRGEVYEPSVASKALKKAARLHAREQFTAKCRRRALRPQGCSIPGEVWL